MSWCVVAAALAFITTSDASVRSVSLLFAGSLLLVWSAAVSLRKGVDSRPGVVPGAVGLVAAALGASVARASGLFEMAVASAAVAVAATALVAVALARPGSTKRRLLYEVSFDALVVAAATCVVSLMLTLDGMDGFVSEPLMVVTLTVPSTLAAALLTYCFQVELASRSVSVTARLLVSGLSLVTAGGFVALPGLAGLVVVQVAAVAVALVPAVYSWVHVKAGRRDQMRRAFALRTSSLVAFVGAVVMTVAVGVLITVRGGSVPAWLVVSSILMLATLVFVRVTHMLREIHASSQRQFNAVTLDSLTGIPNRNWFTRKVSDALFDLANSDSYAGALFICDLDDFKDVNDSLGHSTGDRVLIEVADRLGVAVPPRSLVGRLSGDEFAVWVPGVMSEKDVEVVADAVAAALADPISLGRRQLEFSGSVGAALLDQSSGHNMTELMRRADVAMYYAKRSGKNRCELYRDTMRDVAADRLDLTGALRDAISNGEFVVHFQPLWTIDGTQVKSLEALVRWDRPGVGMVPPDKFLPAAQMSGLMFDIGEIVLDTSLAALKRLRVLAPELTMAVNASVSQLSDPLFATMVAERLASHGLDGSALTVELTETDVVLDFSRIAACIEQLRKLGVRIAIDDFGSGYSSVRYLRDFNPDLVKIDRDIIDEVDGDGSAVDIVRGVLALAVSTGASCVAEGVERDSQRLLLDELGCSLGQGWLYARATPEKDVEDVLRTWGVSKQSPSGSAK